MSQDMTTLHGLKNTSRPKKRTKLLGRGPGSKHGKTSCRGFKGAGSRSGWKARHGAEGGGVPLYRRIPSRGFTRGRFLERLDTINLDRLNTLYSDGETVSLDTLREKGYIRGPSLGIKILGKGSLSKKVKLQVEAISEGAKTKLTEAGIL